MSPISFFFTSRVKAICLPNCRTAVAVAVMAMMISGCASRTSIARINKDPGRYAGKEVTITGRVSKSVGAVGDGIFQINDGSGSMWVYSQGLGVPGSGSKAAISGHILQGFSFGKHTFAVVLKETRRQH